MSAAGGEYEFVQKGALKLKGVSADSAAIKKKKKKSKKHSRKELEELAGSVPSTSAAASSSSAASTSKDDASVDKTESADPESRFYGNKTKSEIAFLKRKEKTDLERIKSKAQVSHKERVEKFNAYLNSLSEHYEPAKVSWTK